MDKMYPRPTGELQGDDRPMPMNESANSGGDTFGASISPDATNAMGSIAGATGSDPIDKTRASCDEQTC